MTEGLSQCVAADVTDSLLLRRAQEHDQQAWEQLVTLYGPLISYWLRHFNVPADDAPDIFQEVFRTVAGKLASYKRQGARYSFRAWMRIITRNKAMDFHRLRKKQGVAAGGTAANARLAEIPASIEQPTDEDENQRELDILTRQALERMKSKIEPTTWTAFWRAAIDGLSAPEVAEELSLTPAAVRQAKSRVLRRLRTELGHLLE